jgi:hypothetical protein
MRYYGHYRLRVLLLSLGVVAGYGSAIAHFTWHRHNPGWHHACEDMSWDAPSSSSAPRDGAKTNPSKAP